MKKKVLIAHLGHWEQLQGGAEQQLEYLTDYLIGENYNVFRAYLNLNNKEVVKPSVELFPIKKKPKIKYLGKDWFCYRSDILDIANKVQPDIIITRTFTSWAGIAAKYASRHGVKHIHFTASDLEAQNLFKTINWFKPFDVMEYYYYCNIYSKKSEIRVQNDFQKQTIVSTRNVEVKKVTQACPVCDVSLIKKHTDKINIVWIGNFKLVKRPEKFFKIIDAFKANENLKFTMIGRCMEEKYQTLLDERQDYPNFDYLGEITNEEVNTFLNKSHILVNTSDYEGFSNTFVQGWMRENIVISLNSNPDSIVTKHNLGYVTASLENTIEIINKLTTNTTTLLEQGSKAREYALNHHSVDKVYRNIVDL